MTTKEWDEIPEHNPIEQTNWTDDLVSDFARQVVSRYILEEKFKPNPIVEINTFLFQYKKSMGLPIPKCLDETYQDADEQEVNNNGLIMSEIKGAGAVFFDEQNVISKVITINTDNEQMPPPQEQVEVPKENCQHMELVKRNGELEKENVRLTGVIENIEKEYQCLFKIADGFRKKNTHLMVSIKKIKELSDSAKKAPTTWDVDKIIRAIKDITNEHLNT